MKTTAPKQRAPRNRTITLNDSDISNLKKRLVKITKPISLEEIENKTIHQDIFKALDYLPDNFVDLVFVDPPYNLDKVFNAVAFKEMESEKYKQWLDSWVSKLVRTLRPHASVYICGDWKSSGAIFNVAKKYFQVRNRITFERENGFDFVYFDPPYGSNNEKMPPSRVRHASYYHIWTTIIKHDKPVVFGKANRREDNRDQVAGSVFEEFRKDKNGSFVAGCFSK